MLEDFASYLIAHGDVDTNWGALCEMSQGFICHNVRLEVVKYCELPSSPDVVIVSVCVMNEGVIIAGDHLDSYARNDVTETVWQLWRLPLTERETLVSLIAAIYRHHLDFSPA